MLQLKKDPWVLTCFTLLAIGLGVLCKFDVITWKEALAGLGVLLAPSALGRKNDDDDKGAGQTPVLVDDVPPAHPRAGGSLLRPISNALAAWRSRLTMLLASVMLILTTSGCAHDAISRAEARGAVLATAQAVKIGDEACAKWALNNIDVALARACEKAYVHARLTLIVAADGIDAWDEGKRAGVLCAVVHAAEDLAKVAEEFRKRRIKVPAVLEDAIALTRALGGCDE